MKTLEQICEEILSGARSGATLEFDGSEAKLPQCRQDLVTLVSWTFRREELTVARVRGFLARYSRAPAWFYVGLWAFGDSMVSLDFNVMVPQQYRAVSLSFANRNNQKALWDCWNEAVVPVNSLNSGASLLECPVCAIRIGEELARGRDVAL